MSGLSWIVFASFFLLCYTPITSSSSLYKNTSRHLCVQGDRFALLQLKADLNLQNAWVEENDCCGWEGVRCNLLTGHVIQLAASPKPFGLIGWGVTISPNSSLFLLRHLEVLDLSSNYINSSLPSNISALSHLRYLDLSTNFIHGEIPIEISQLSRLTSLDLSKNLGQIKMSVLDKIVRNMTLLRELHLSEVIINSSFPNSLTNLSSLVFLDLSWCLLKGNLPVYMGNLPRLQYLDLLGNTLSTNFTTFRWSSPFQTLSLSSCDFTGSLTHLFGPTHSLEYLTLHGNSFYGPIPPWVFNVSREVDLSDNEFGGNVDLSSFTNNILIFLSNSGLSVIATKKNDDNLNSCSLEVVELSSCNISIFPEVLRSCNALGYLDLSMNSLGGEIPHWLREMPYLSVLNLSYNHLVGNLGNAPQSVSFLDIRSNMLGGRIPDFGSDMMSFQASNNQLNGEIPSSFCNMTNLEFLDLSNNNLYGRFPTCLASYGVLYVLNLRSNQLHGVLPSNFSKCYSLNVLDVNDNRLEGPIPQSLGWCPSIQVLDLGNNMFNHSFPYWLDSLPELQLLVLRNNNFHGVITASEAEYPFPKLQIADFSENNFCGPLPRRYIENFEGMQDADDSFHPLQYMTQAGESVGFSILLKLDDLDDIDELGQLYYRDSTVLNYKDLNQQYQQILTNFASLDLSCNRFDGEIPDSIGNLISLKGLNLSHNHLTGSIPPSVGNLTGLESLDLSSNLLSGDIPQQLSSLSFLSCFNVSENHLVGRIPRGKQLDTFQNNSYLGNPGLCGFPLPDCGEHSTSSAPSTKDDHKGTELLEWEAVLMGYGTGIFFGFVGGYYLYLLGKPVWLMRLIYKAEFMLMEQRKKRAWRYQRKKSTARNG